jgi:hypothetical protein
MKIAKKKVGLVTAQLDVSKAFNMTPHQATENALHWERIPEYMVKLLSDLYEEVTAKIKQGTVEVPI